MDVLKASYKERPKFVSKTLIIFCSVIYDNYAFNKCKPKPSDDGNISCRCVFYQIKGIKCHSSFTIRRLPNGEEIMIRAPKEHIGHGKYTEATKCF